MPVGSWQLGGEWGEFDSVRRLLRLARLSGPEINLFRSAHGSTEVARPSGSRGTEEPPLFVESEYCQLLRQSGGFEGVLAVAEEPPPRRVQNPVWTFRREPLCSSASIAIQTGDGQDQLPLIQIGETRCPVNALGPPAVGLSRPADLIVGLSVHRPSRAVIPSSVIDGQPLRLQFGGGHRRRRDAWRGSLPRLRFGGRLRLRSGYRSSRSAGRAGRGGAEGRGGQAFTFRVTSTVTDQDSGRRVRRPRHLCRSTV